MTMRAPMKSWRTAAGLCLGLPRVFGSGYTLECGHDAIKGSAMHVPRGGTSIVALGMGLSALPLAHRKLRHR